MSNLKAVIDCFGQEPFTVLRPQGGESIKGEYIRRKPKKFSADGAWQPADGKVLQMLPEGVRSRETWQLWTDCELFNADSISSREADIIKRDSDGCEFEVMLIRPWFREGGYNKAVLVRLGQ